MKPDGVAIACTTEQLLLGEGARWDARTSELLRVDILAGRVFRDRVAADGSLIPVRSYRVPGTVGAIAPVEGEAGWLLAAGRDILHLDPDGSLQTVAESVAPFGTRMNDAACDPQGRFWAGTMAFDQHPGGGALYRLSRDGHVAEVLPGLTIANGLGWSPDGTVMYVTDSGDRCIRAYPFDAREGTLAAGRVLITLDEAVGAPDGLTMDVGGDLWVAVYGGGQVRRYSPDGQLRQTVTVPARQTTCCSFGGPGLSWLYITTGTEGWTDEARRADPRAGVVYQVQTDRVGIPAAPFRPQSEWWTGVAARDSAQ